MLRKDNKHSSKKTDKDKNNKETSKAHKVQTNDGPSGPLGNEGPSHRVSWADGIKKSLMGLKKVKSLDVKLK